jgi:hypothetical protein
MSIAVEPKRHPGERVNTVMCYLADWDRSMQIDRGLLQFPRLYGCTDLDVLSRASS